jgi:hypothetical protein
MAMLTRAPVIGKLMIRALFDQDDMIYLPKDEVPGKTQPKTRTIEMSIVPEPKNIVLPSQIVEHFIRESRCISVMNQCMCRDANKCKDYSGTLGAFSSAKGY